MWMCNTEYVQSFCTHLRRVFAGCQTNKKKTPQKPWSCTSHQMHPLQFSLVMERQIIAKIIKPNKKDILSNIYHINCIELRKSCIWPFYFTFIRASLMSLLKTTRVFDVKTQSWYLWWVLCIQITSTHEHCRKLGCTVPTIISGCALQCFY